MSRTDAHRPDRVRINDHPELVVERHDHTDGCCQLAGVPLHLRGSLLQEVGGSVCHVWFAADDPPCSCPMCSPRRWLRWNRRTVRAAERTWTRAAARGLTGDDLDALEARLLHRRPNMPPV